jgi:multiple sugar transport system permease protein
MKSIKGEYRPMEISINKNSQTNRIRFNTGFWAMCVATLVFLIPAIWLILTALKKETEYNSYPIVWFPDPAQWINFIKAVTIIPFFKYAQNSLLLAVMSAVLTTITSAMAGYGFARHTSVKARNGLFILVLSMIMVPGMVTLIPRFVLYSRLGLIGTYWPWILESIAGSAFHIFLFKQFFSTIPRDLEDAAEVDGCSRFRIFWQIFLPLSGAVVATSLIFNFQYVWGEWLRPVLYLTDYNTTLAVKMASGYRDPLQNQLVTPLMAAICIYALPLIILFFFAQKHIVQGVVTSGLKG